MPNEINDFNKKNTSPNKSKRWRGLKQDSSGKYLVYVTDSNERLFENLDEAVKYLKESAQKEDIKKCAKSKENVAEQRGQEGLEGLKEVITRRKLVQTANGYKVLESKRYNIKSDTAENAKEKLEDIDNAKEETTAKPIEEVKKEKEMEKTSALEYGSIGVCLQCHASIYPPNTDMDYWFNRQIPADTYCPACGFSIGTPGNFNYENALMNEQSVDNLVKGASLSEEEVAKIQESYKGYSPADFSVESVENDIKYDYPNYEESDFERVTGVSKEKYTTLTKLIKEMKKIDNIVEALGSLQYSIERCVEECGDSKLVSQDYILNILEPLKDDFLKEISTKSQELKDTKQALEKQYFSLFLEKNLLS